MRGKTPSTFRIRTRDGKAQKYTRVMGGLSERFRGMLPGELAGSMTPWVQAIHEALDPDIVSATLSFIDQSPPDMKASLQRDMEAGRRSELESMIGIVVRLGKELGVSTPMMRIAYAVLKPGELKNR